MLRGTVRFATNPSHVGNQHSACVLAVAAVCSVLAMTLVEITAELYPILELRLNYAALETSL